MSKEKQGKKIKFSEEQKQNIKEHLRNSSEESDANMEDDSSSVVIGGKKYKTLTFNKKKLTLDKSKLIQSNKKEEVKTRYFRVMKRGQTQKGKKFVFCQSHGKGILIEEGMAIALELNFTDEVFNIPVDKFYINKTDKEDIYKLFLKVPPSMWYGLENLKIDLEDGIWCRDFQKVVSEAGLDTQEVVHPKFGRFIAVRPSDTYRIDDRHRINIYPGNSIKNFGLRKLSLLEFIEKYQKRITFKSFTQGDKVYYRFYLRKIKNSFMPKEKSKKNGDSLGNKGFSELTIDAEMLLKLLKKEPPSDVSDMKDLDTLNWKNL
jgi:hypothetical protein